MHRLAATILAFGWAAAVAPAYSAPVFEDKFDNYPLGEAHLPGGLWTTVDIGALQENGPGLIGLSEDEGDHHSTGVHRSEEGPGGKVVTTVDGGNWLAGGRSSLFSRKVVDKIESGVTYTLEVDAVSAGSSRAEAGIAFATEELEWNPSTPGLSAPFLIFRKVGSPAEWTRFEVSYVGAKGDAGKPLYVSLISYRGVSTSIIGWANVRVSSDK